MSLRVSPSVTVHGVRAYGATPLGRVFFPLSACVYVLYGINGSGKTTFLNGLKPAALATVENALGKSKDTETKFLNAM